LNSCPPWAVFDLDRPWLRALQPALGRVLAALQAGRSVAQALDAADPAGGGPRFLPQSSLPAGEAYEAFIQRSGGVPTRDNAHDLFNGLVWLTRPAIKRRLNALQAAEIHRAGVSASRGALRDALTLFDESGAWLQAPPELAATLQARDWQALFVTHRARWAEASLTIVGHALLDKLASAPRKALTAHVLLVDPLALDAAGWAAKPFFPMPVLGVPGWWSDNADPDFYNDSAVFRRRQST
jgi:hypothetical protein